MTRLPRIPAYPLWQEAYSIHLQIRVVKVGQIRPYLVQWCSDVKNDGISERGDWPL
ncbi:TPA: hypothetical protein P0N91_003497 [Yersinia enterocolitica]|nr:hypothetical protein [Yersinia enterocolitica]